MKTLFLTQDFPPQTGGISRLYGELCAHLPVDSVEVVTVLAPPDYHDAGNVVRMPWTQRDAKRLTNVLRWIRWLRRRLRRADVSLIQAGNIRPTGYLAAWARVRHGVPYVLYVHGKDLLKEARRARSSGRVRVTAREIFGNASAIIANSRFTAELTRQVMQQIGCAGLERVRVVHPGTDPQVFKRDEGGAARWREKLQARGPLLLTVARLMPRKGIDTTLQAVAALRDEFPELRYAVVGSGPDAERLHALVDRLGIHERVNFLSGIPDAALPGLYSAADVFVLPVREDLSDDEVEGFGIVYCEAAACECPVVAGASGGTRDAVRDGETGVLVPPDDAAALGGALRELLRNPARLRELGKNGRRAVESYYNWERAAADVLKIIAGL
jgi:phosphatidylinositol alpha-1,6-mannosyltransferase